MTDRDAALRQIEEAAGRLIPELSERLGRHGLGEIEVRHGGLRIRVAGGGAAAAAAAPPEPAGTEPAPVPGMPDPVAGAAVASPAVGFFVYADGLGPGLAVEKGDSLGYVEMLGVRHDVRAPRRGSVRNLVAETGEAVEYGQTVVELDPLEAGG